VALLERHGFLYNHSGDFPQVILIVPSHVPNKISLYSYYNMRQTVGNQYKEDILHRPRSKCTFSSGGTVQKVYILLIFLYIKIEAIEPMKRSNIPNRQLKTV
jgi:hypothetical protein